jgi:hypothetical protein
MSRTCGPRDIISLVIPRIGDNIAQGEFSFFINSKEGSMVVGLRRETISRGGEGLGEEVAMKNSLVSS